MEMVITQLIKDRSSYAQAHEFDSRSFTPSLPYMADARFEENKTTEWLPPCTITVFYVYCIKCIQWQ